MRRTVVRLAAVAMLTTGVVLSSAAQGTGGRIYARLQGFDAEVALDTLVVVRDKVSATSAAVLGAVREVYAKLDIPKPVSDSLGRVIYNVQFSATTRLAGERLSRYFGCGDGPSGENADYFRITMAIATYVDTMPDGTTRVGTGLAASARDMGGNSTAPVRCASTGRFEERIATLVKGRLSAR